jgi:predicted small lipoprotein YifL
MRNKLKAAVLSGLLVLTLSGCGYDGHYRYPCQDPDNWETKECKPPACLVSGTCPEVLLPLDTDISEWRSPSGDTITQSEKTELGETDDE